MVATNCERVTRSRGLITFTERDPIADNDGVEDSKRFQAISRMRCRINEEVVEEVGLLRKHHPDLLKELQEVGCDEE